MTDAQYWTIANSLPKRQVYGGVASGQAYYVWNVDWRSAIAGCDPNIREACEFVLGFNPMSQCWVDPGAQYVNRPNPYPAPSSWGVSVCNPPTTSGGGSTSSGGGTTNSGGSSSGTVPGSQSPEALPSLNMNYVLIGLAVLGVMMFARK